MVKYLILFSAFCPFVSKGQTGVFNYEGGKIVYKDSIITEKPFSFFTKTKINEYAKLLNSKMKYEDNKMKNYIVYEDSATIVFNIRFLTEQTLIWTIVSGVGTFKKERGIFKIIVEDLKIDKSGNLFTGLGADGATIEIVDKSGDAKKAFVRNFLNKLNIEIVKFLKLLKS